MTKAKWVFTPAAGCPRTQADIDIIGPELARIAESYKVDVPQLTSKQVKLYIEKHKASPLWQFINTSPKKAMEKWIQRQCYDLIRHVRVDRVDIRPVGVTAQPAYYPIEDSTLKGAGGVGATKVSTVHSYNDEGLSSRIADGIVTRVRQEVQRLYNCALTSAAPERYKQLAKQLKACLEEFDKKNGKEAA